MGNEAVARGRDVSCPYKSEDAREWENTGRPGERGADAVRLRGECVEIRWAWEAADVERAAGLGVF
jgi:hypothetical protein